MIFQQFLFQATFPAALKDAIVQPIYKGKGNKHFPSSYRHVSLCSVLGKTLDQMVKDQLMNHIASVCPLSRKQHGFCARRSTVTNLLEFDNIIGSWENNRYNNNRLPYDVITIDFCRAFDKVPHSLLLDKLSAKRLHQTTLCWFNSFISIRRQQVRINSHLSEPIDVTSGVIQGSSVGPRLFSITSIPC